jgi:hypothetical protein
MVAQSLLWMMTAKMMTAGFAVASLIPVMANRNGKVSFLTTTTVVFETTAMDIIVKQWCGSVSFWYRTNPDADQNPRIHTSES